ncbi:hypothetical protein HK101_007033, partial [Irineochytrium annulatum]
MPSIPDNGADPMLTDSTPAGVASASAVPPVIPVNQPVTTDLQNMSNADIAQLVAQLNNQVQQLLSRQQTATRGLVQIPFSQHQSIVASMPPAGPPSANPIPTTATTVNSANLRPFRTPSSEPPLWDGSCLKKSSHESVREIADYLDLVARKAKMHDFLEDGAAPRYLNHVTYAQWAITGLKHLALTYFNDSARKEPLRAANMTWKEYCDWVRFKFTPTLASNDATDKFIALTQRGSAINYSIEFNTLVSAFAAKGIIHHDEFLRNVYRRGLKPHLRTELSIYRARDLTEMQQNAEE